MQHKRSAVFGGPCSPRRCFHRVRVIAYQQTYLAFNLSELGPGYDCRTCKRPEQDIPAGCPACPLGQLEDGYRGLVAEQIAAADDGAQDWEIETLEQDIAHVRRMMTDSGQRIDPAWPALVVGVARAIQAGDREATDAIEWTIRHSKPKKAWM